MTKNAQIKAKFKFQEDCVNQTFSQNAFFSYFLNVLYDITVQFAYYTHDSHHLEAMKVIVSKVFLICMFKDQKLAEDCFFF